MLTSNVVITSTDGGATQHVSLQSVTSGSFTLDFTYDVKPLGLASDANHTGTLTAGTYYYRVTAVTGAGETLASNETSKTVGASGAIQLDWGDVPGALAYKVYRRSGTAGTYTVFGAPGPSFLDDGTAAVVASGATLPVATSVHGLQTTVPISFNAPLIEVKTALELLLAVGAGNVNVTGSAGSYTVAFMGALAATSIALMTGSTSALRSNGIHAIVTSMVKAARTASTST